MPTFNAGAIEASATLDRSDFIAGLDELSAKADELSKKKISPKIDLSDLDKARTQLDGLKTRIDNLSKRKITPKIDLTGLAKAGSQFDQLAARADKLGKKKITPKVDLSGLTKAKAQIALLQAQADKLGRTSASPTVKVDTKDGEQGLKRLLDGILALAPALVPLGAAGIGGAAGLAAAFTAAGAGAGAFALAAVPAIKKVASAEDALQTAVQSRTKAQKSALDGLTTGEEQAARKLQGLVQTYHGFSDALEPTTFTVLAKGAGIASTALHDIAPVAHTTGQALAGLEDEAKTALDTKFYRTFFDYLGVEAPRSVGTFGRSLGNVGTGFAGILQAFTPVEHQLEDGILHLTQKFANFGKGAGTNQGVQEFISYIEQEGPKAVKLIGQFGSTFAQVAKDAAPLGAAELRIISGLLGFVDAEAKAHPRLVELALTLYTLNKTASTLKLSALVSGTAGAGKSLIGIGTGVAGIALGTKTVAQVFPRVAKATGAVGTAATGARVGMLDLGEAMGAGEAAGIGLASGFTAVVGGLVALQAIFSRGKLSVDQQTQAIITNDKATGNNLSGYKKALTDLQSLQDKYSKSRNKALITAGGASDPTGKAFALQAINAKQVGDAYDKLSQKDKNVIEGAAGIQTQMKALGPQYKLTATQALSLANTLGVDLSKGWKGSSQAAQDNRAKIAEYIAEVKQSHDPTAQFSADIKLAGDKAQTATQQQQGFNSAIQLYQDLTSSTIASAAQVGQAIAGLSGDFKKGTTAAERNGAAATILSGNYSKLVNSGPQTKKFAGDLTALQGTFSQTYEQMFKTASESGHTAKGFQDVTSAARVNEKALQQQLEKMGLSASAAKQLADKFAGVPKDITTKAHLVGVQQVEGDAAGMKKKIEQIPVSHSTTAQAQVKAAETNIATLKGRIKDLPPTAKTTAIAEIRDAESALNDLKDRIYDLTHRKWTVTIDSEGNINTPRSSFGPVQTSQAAGGFLNFGGREGVDSIHAMLAPKEYVTNSKIVRREGVPAFDALNAGKATIVPLHRADGGLIDITAQTNASALAGQVSGFTSKMESAQKYAKSLLASMVNYKAGAGVAQWAPTILKALSIMHQPAGLLGTVERRMNQESGGNPNAINLWDSNAQAGDPSRGLMQTIMATFRSYHYPGTSNNIYDPLANILASMRYAIAKYGSLSAAYNKAGGYRLGGLVSEWFGDGVTGAIFDKPTIIGVGEKGAERVDVTPVKGYASGGAAKKQPKIPGTTFTSPKLFEQAGSRLLDVILGSLTGSRARSSIQQIDNSIIHSIDADFTGSSQSGLVKYTQKVNQQMLGLATARDRIASKLAAANQLSTSVTSGAKSFADVSQFTALGSNNLLKEFHSKLASINKFDSNIATMKRHGFSSELISELIAAGIDQAAPVAQQLAKARPAQVHQFNATQRSVDRAAKKLGTVAVNAQFGTSAAHSFVAELNRQQNSLERQMRALAKVFAHGVGHAFHIKGYASGGHATGLAVVGERGPELADFGAHGAMIHPDLHVGGTDVGPLLPLLVRIAEAVEAGQVIMMDSKKVGRSVTRRQKIDAVRVPA